MDGATGKPFVDVVVDQAEQKGTGRWTVQIALDLGVPVSGIAEAVFARSLSGHAALRDASRGLAGPQASPLGESEAAAFADRVEQALYASKIVSYTQGFHEIAAGSEEYDWDIDLGAVSAIWRGGCIIRAAFLDRIRAAYDARPDLPSLLSDETFAQEIAAAQDDWREVLVAATRQGVPTPGFAAALAYYDALRAERLPAALTQGSGTSSGRTRTAGRTGTAPSTRCGAVTGPRSPRSPVPCALPRRAAPLAQVRGGPGSGLGTGSGPGGIGDGAGPGGAGGGCGPGPGAEGSAAGRGPAAGAWVAGRDPGAAAEGSAPGRGPVVRPGPAADAGAPGPDRERVLEWARAGRDPDTGSSWRCPPASRSTSALWTCPPPTRRPPPHSPAGRTPASGWPSVLGRSPRAAAPAASPGSGLASTGTRAVVDFLAGAMDAWARTITSAPVTASAASATRRR